jgi:hypothetical protein
VLFGVLLVLLTGAAVATAHFYWSSLRGGLAQMRASVAAAQAQQQQLVERLRAAQAALAERSAADVTAVAPPPAGVAPAAPAGATVPAFEPAPPRPPMLPAAERARLALRLDGLGRSAARLPPTRRPKPGAAARHLVRDQLAIAATAAEAGDSALLDAALFAAQRLLGAPYRAPDVRATTLAAQVTELRRHLRGLTGAADTAPQPPSREAAATGMIPMR